ncbi:MAG: hypothetical protein WDK96_01750 [Candidatus Paceibacterota bacterium]|jgi:hypothetical protein
MRGKNLEVKIFTTNNTKELVKQVNDFLNEKSRKIKIFKRDFEVIDKSGYHYKKIVLLFEKKKVKFTEQIVIFSELNNEYSIECNINSLFNESKNIEFCDILTNSYVDDQNNYNSLAVIFWKK